MDGADALVVRRHVKMVVAYSTIGVFSSVPLLSTIFLLPSYSMLAVEEKKKKKKRKSYSFSVGNLLLLSCARCAHNH